MDFESESCKMAMYQSQASKKFSDENFEDLSLQEQDGVTYTRIALDVMFTISNRILLLLPSRDSFGILPHGIAKVPNIDVHDTMEQIVAVTKTGHIICPPSLSSYVNVLFKF
jgi:hypothetical protein